ncbi:MAG: TolC family protein [Bacteroidota bacterium]
MHRKRRTEPAITYCPAKGTVEPGNERSQRHNYEVGDSIILDTKLALGDLQHELEKTNPSLLIAKKNIDIANFSLKERRAERFPVVSFNSAYNFSRVDNKTVINPFSPLFSQAKGLNYGFTAAIPILNNFTTRRLIKQAQLDIQFQQLVYGNQRSLVNLSVLNAFKGYEAQKKHCNWKKRISCWLKKM